MNKQNNIPKHWQVKKLGEVLKVSSGKGLKVNNLQGGDYPVYGGNGINGYHTEYFIENPKLIIGRVGVKCGVTYITKPKSWVTDNALIVEPIIKDFDLKFFKLKLEYENLNKLSVSTAQPVISGSRIYEYEILLPPLPEQHQIVSKIEELLSDLDNGKQQLLTAQQQLKVYRQSLLKWAFEGRLTSGTSAPLSDRNSASAVVERSRNHNGELPEGWKWVKLGELIEKPQYGTSKKCQYDIIGKGVLRIPNISNGIIDSSDLKFAAFDNDEIESYSLKEGDILTIRSNGSVDLVGKCALINKKDEHYLFAGYLIKLRPKKNTIMPKYLLNALSSAPLRNQIENKAKSTSGVNNINSEELKSLDIPICSISEQYQIVQLLERKLTICNKIEETISQSLQQAETLRQSILKKAFEGKLM